MMINADRSNSANGMLDANGSKRANGSPVGADDNLTGPRSAHETRPYGAQEPSAWANVGRRFTELHEETWKSRCVEEPALTDALTGLPNRRAIEQWAVRQLSGAVRHNFSFWVIMADLDQFKSINDAYGRDPGDAVLKKFAEILQANTRQCDMCGRIGGDKFVLVITHSKEDGVRLAIERLREQVESQKLMLERRPVPITASFGMAGLRRGPHLDFGRLLVQADVALHSAKRLGRNRVEIVPAEAH